MAEAFQEAARRDHAKPYLISKLAATEADMVTWMAGLLLAQTKLVAALIKLLSANTPQESWARRHV
jgi:hypothetical protein